MQEGWWRACGIEKHGLDVSLSKESLRNSSSLIFMSRGYDGCAGKGSGSKTYNTLRVLGKAMSGSGGGAAAASTGRSALYSPSQVEPSLHKRLERCGCEGLMGGGAHEGGDGGTVG